MDDGNSHGTILAARPQISLRCGPFNAHDECESPLCDCPHHGALISRRALADMMPERAARPVVA